MTTTEHDLASQLGGQPLPDITLADLEEDPELMYLKQATLSARIRLSLIDMRKATRLLIDENPNEARLLFFVLMSDVIFFLNAGLKFVISPTGQGIDSALPESLAGTLGGLIVLCFLFRTASLYVFSGAVTMVSRLFGGRGSWSETRAGIFWASLVAAPVGVLSAVLVTTFGYLEATNPIFGSDLIQLPAQMLGVVAFVYLSAAAVAEAQRFSRVMPVLVAFLVLALILLVALLTGFAMVKDRLA
ncbi:MAG: YIP1 family protein [Pseudomonadota bacterium]